MKIKFLTVAVISVLIYSCSPKVAVPVAEVKNVALTPELAEGKVMYENNCANCHKLFPASKHTKEEWIPVLNNMAKKAKLTEEQKGLVYNYLVAGL